MTRTKIAPTLEAHVRACYCQGDEEDRQATRELRALLTCARLLARVAETSTEPDNGWTDIDWTRVDRALARLASVSSGKRGAPRRRSGGTR